MDAFQAIELCFRIIGIELAVIARDQGQQIHWEADEEGGGVSISRGIPRTMMRLKNVELLRDRVTSWDTYPFNVKCIRSLSRIDIRSRVCFFVGENGSGKSTLLEAIAAHYGFRTRGR